MFPSPDNPDFSDEIGMGGDTGVGKEPPTADCRLPTADPQSGTTKCTTSITG